ncbi:MAG TPA: Mov34/MPN/PAD-1 family protein [Baekduia sp.]|nr:Mov34/MPN/PAD-1 family protein [Baekduia sp.]
MWLGESAAAAIERAAEAAHPREAGGVLLGVLTRGRRPWIVEAVAVPSDRAGTHFYELPANARYVAAQAARERDERLGYVGDWHSHPADVGPSGTDVATMVALARADRSRPLLLIARRRGERYDHDVREVVRGDLRPARVIMAGGLGSGDARP